MYHLLLTRKYLTSKIMPTLAVLAVTLSVATVLVTWSVMGGVLRSLIASGERLIGDVQIDWPNVGFAHYDELIGLLEAEPEIVAASPVIETLGMVAMPNGDVPTLQVRGIDPESFHRVTGYADMLWWRPAGSGGTRDTRPDPSRSPARVRAFGPDAPAQVDLRLDEEWWDEFAHLLANGVQMRREDRRTGTLLPEVVRGAAVGAALARGEGLERVRLLAGRVYEPAAVLGIEVSPGNLRTDRGWYMPLESVTRPTTSGRRTLAPGFLPRDGRVSLSVLRLDSRGEPREAERMSLPVANEFHTGMYEVDQRTMLVPLEVLQRMLGMSEARRLVRDVGPFGGFDPDEVETEVDPARVTSVLVLGQDELTPEQVQSVCRRVYSDFASRHPGEVPSSDVIAIQTFEEQNATLINAIRNETGVVLVIFAIVCLTVVFLVLAIFWSMISEKTKDIGVLRSLGASRTGVAGLWLSYGLGLGLVGAGLGVVLALLVVDNINEIHEVIKRLTGRAIWDASVYYFSTIPAEMEFYKAAVVAVAGVMTSVFGAAVPAIRAAMLHPVRALRFE